MSRDGAITPDLLPLVTRLGSGLRPASSLRRSLADVGRDHMDAVLKSVGGNRSKAAGILGIGEATLYRDLRGRVVDARRRKACTKGSLG